MRGENQPVPPAEAFDEQSKLLPGRGRPSRSGFVPERIRTGDPLISQLYRQQGEQTLALKHIKRAQRLSSAPGAADANSPNPGGLGQH